MVATGFWDSKILIVTPSCGRIEVIWIDWKPDGSEGLVVMERAMWEFTNKLQYC